tara:strand:- start:1537 stop:1710 length:174 start_codon:yes stop_codon:yes gene_type:complete
LTLFSPIEKLMVYLRVIELKNGGEGRIVKILYVVMDNEDEVLFLKICDLGNHTQKDI